MKKRVLLIGLVLVVCGLLALLGYVFRASLYKPVAYKQMTSLFPARPLIYMQCAQLASRLKDFSQRSSYQAFLQSPLFDQIQKTLWWQGFSSSLQDALQGMAVDPLRIVGADTAIGVYQAKEGEVVPGVLVVTKIDPTVNLTERLLYLMDSVSGAFGVQKQFEISGIPVYKLQHKEMIVPLYYSILGNLGMISTSFPLLQHTLLQALGKPTDLTPAQTEELEPQNPFGYIVDASKPERFVTLYWDASKILHELQQYKLFDLKEFFDEALLASLAALPFFQVAVEVSEYSLVVSLEVFPPSLPSEKMKPFQENNYETTVSTLIHTTPQQYPLLATVNRARFESLFSTLKQLFPQQSWQEALRWHKQQSLIWGERVECRLTTNLFGTVYTTPDLACILDTQHPQRAKALLQYAVNMLFERLFPSAIQRRTMVSAVNESYRDSTISSARVLFQEVFAYAVSQPSSQPVYTIVATNTQVVKSSLDALRDHPEQSPFTPMPRVLFAPDSSRSSTTISIGGIFIRTIPLLELLEALSKTSTFGLLFPQEVYPGLYQIIPALRQSEAALPDVILLSIQVQETESLSIRLLFRKS
ncbi:hypothetical protein U27_02359 [Candidatus Vecturithrix granuli]|uniref:DUF3352 domain-containing protein n=1 Tax=Vecturithrix granuli TaxID=1499967 RepID=A0A0S6W768_VECG1|nr:hypothetical protein U27_02359 [Candidatus Vecturithrix granuli]